MMCIFRHEMKQNRKTLIIWTAVVAGMIAVCMFMYPEMKNQMEEVSDMFSSMGGFTAAFGMDQVSFGEVMGFYAIEGGNMIGIGGALFAAMVGVGMLAKEEDKHTAEFLFAQPVSRIRVIAEKLLAGISIVVIFNLVCMICAIISFYCIGESIVWKDFLLFHTAQLLMQIEIFGICFAISAFMKKSAIGIGIGIGMLLYFLNIVKNITEGANWLKYITPFHYADAAQVLSEGKIEWTMVSVGMIYFVIALALAFYQFNKKDLAS